MSWQPSLVYPDPAIEIFDPEFSRLRLFNASVECLYQGTRWGEGPVWFGAGRYLVWSDLPNDRLLRWDECTGQVGIFRAPSNQANGNTCDRQGRLLCCQNRGRCVTRTEFDGSITVLADRFDGKRLNSPNDIVVKSDGSIWFTDPPFGIINHYEGAPAEQELPAAIYRIDPESGVLEVVADDILGPNGLCFSPDESRLYVVESRGVPNRKIRSFAVRDGRRLVDNTLVLDAGPGTPDGMRCDTEGNLWCGWGMGTPELDGVRVFSPEGKPLGHIHLPERCANVAFGGRHRNRLFMAAGHALYALYVNAQGATPG